MKYKNLETPRKPEQIRSALHTALISGEFKPGEFIPPEQELSQKFNVSRYTVREATTMLMNEGYLSRIQGKGTIVTVPGSKKTDNIMLILSAKVRNSISNPFYSKIIEGVEKALKTTEYHLSIASVESNRKNPLELPVIINQKKIDGVLALGQISLNLLRKIDSSGIDMVLIDNYLPELSVNSVVSDNVEGAKRVISHLIELGHKKIAMLVGTGENVSIAGRIKGYRSAFKNACIEKEQVVWKKNGVMEFEDGYELMDNLLKKERQLPTAIFAVNDRMALGAIKAVYDSGLQVPGNISIVGYDDIPQSSFNHPSLTTVRVEKEKMGKLAVEMLLARITSGSKKPPENKIIPVSIVIRESSGKPNLDKKRKGGI